MLSNLSSKRIPPDRSVSRSYTGSRLFTGGTEYKRLIAKTIGRRPFISVAGLYVPLLPKASIFPMTLHFIVKMRLSDAMDVCFFVIPTASTFRSETS